MKKILFLLVFLCAAFPLSAWVFLDSVEKDGSGWLLPKMLSGQPVRVCIDVLEEKDSSLTPQLELYQGPRREAYYAMSAQIVYSAYQSWFDNVREQIRISKRKKEFKDLLATWPKKVSFQFVNIGPAVETPYQACASYPQQAIDLHIRAVLHAPNAPLPQYGRAQNVFAFPLNPDYTGLVPQTDGNDISSLAVALHEAGHTLGLASSEKTDSYGEMSPVYASPTQHAPSVMKGGKELTYDDAEGLINLADYFSKIPSLRVQGGWLGFGPSQQAVYSQGVSVPVTAQQAQAHMQFVMQQRQGVAPLQEEIAAALDKAARYLRIKKTAQDKEKEGLRRDVVQAVSAVRNAEK